MLRLLTLLALLLAGPALAASAVQNPNTRVELIAESRAPAPGRPLTVALVFRHQPGWHTYWKNPGDAGMETRAAWTLPGRATASDLRYPVPGRLLVSGLMNYVYEQDTALLADIAVPALPAGAAFPLKVKVDYLVCTDELCVPESATLDLPLTIGDGAPDPAATGRLAAARAALPRPLAEPARYAVAGERFTLAVPVAAGTAVSGAYFFPLGEGAADFSAPQTVTRTGDTLRLETKAAGSPSGPVAGVLRIDRPGAPPLGLALTATPGAVPPAGTALSAAAPDAPGNRAAGFATALLLAIAGGILLNVMPCVFPILSLQALSLAKAGGEASAARRDALAYTAGAVLICVALGGILLALRAAGEAAGWAFQLQDPRVVLALLLLTTGIALNLAGLFEITLSAGNAGQSLAAKPGVAGSFWTGALAAFVATPCTGPFMAGALGAALVLPPAQGLAIFAGLGLGLALPFLAIGYVPALRRRLPKPGPWMDRFRRLMSVPMFLTALALAWVLGRQAGVEGMTLGLAGALLLGLALWWYGRAQHRERRNWLPLGIATAAAIAAITFVPRAAPAEARAAPAGVLAAAPFSEAALAQATATGPAFVYFTADWCVTCKVNERGALASPEVAAAFDKAGVKVLVGDWTDGDAAIGKFLAARGRAGVPLYLYYADGKVEELPQLLTAARLVALTT